MIKFFECNHQHETRPGFETSKNVPNIEMQISHQLKDQIKIDQSKHELLQSRLLNTISLQQKVELSIYLFKLYILYQTYTIDIEYEIELLDISCI